VWLLVAALAAMSSAAQEPERIEIRPQPGFQESVLASSADIVIAGGSAGCGKSWCSAVEPLRFHNVPGFSAIIFRRTSDELTGAGSIWEETQKLYPAFGAGAREKPTLDWRFPSGASVKLSHLQLASDVRKHQSKAYALIIFEEGTHFDESQFWYMFSRNRSSCGVRPYMRVTCNPDPDSFIAKLIEWWIDQETGYPIPERGGVIRYFLRLNDELHWGDSPEELRERFPEIPEEDFSPRTLTFIPGKLEDNPAMMRADPDYRGKLLAMTRVEQERLLRGNWKIRPAAGLYFQSSQFEIVSKLPAPVEQVVRWWDKAATEPSPKNPDPDWTAGIKMARLQDGRFAVLHVERFRGGPSVVDRRMKAIASQDGRDVAIGVFQDPGQAGKVDIAHMRRLLQGYRLQETRPTKDKVTSAGPWSSEVTNNGALLLKGPWNAPFVAEHENFPDADKDDQVDGAAAGYIALQRNTLAFGSA
jgi:predicted phage terminase large subunit-like protein